MTHVNAENLTNNQGEQRAEYLERIINSKSPRKLIVAGAGTGKTYTFKQLLLRVGGDHNVAMTFIRKLAADTRASLGELARVFTFHAYCKRVLHQLQGTVNLYPQLTTIITKDAQLLGRTECDFDSKIRLLDESGGDIDFYLEQGDYYDAISFDDSVLRLLRMIQENPDALPPIEYLVVDEYQDFNPLEVAFIRELSKHAQSLIVGDDDQAIYAGRSASPDYLRDLYHSGDYETFELPFCSRCTPVIVEATNSIIKRATEEGLLSDRIEKDYVCYFEDKAEDGERYPSITVVRVPTVKSVASFVLGEIRKIPENDIRESYEEDYPTALIVGPKHYIRQILSTLEDVYGTNVISKSQPQMGWTDIDAYSLLSINSESNLAWRLLVANQFDDLRLKEIIDQAYATKTPLVKLLEDEFVVAQMRIADAITNYRGPDELTTENTQVLIEKFGIDYEATIDSILTEVETEEEQGLNVDLPSIHLTTLVGCKGLSAGHTFIVGVNNGDIPKEPEDIQDIEVSQFIVALTRTRKSCSIISNKWFGSPTNKKGDWNDTMPKSEFLNWLPEDLINDLGYLKKAEIEARFRVNEE